MKKTKILDAVIIFIIAVIIILFINAPLVKLLGVWGMALAELLMVFAPATIILLRKESISDRFNLKLPSIRSFFSAALFMLGVNMWENAATFVYVSQFGIPEQNDVVFMEAFFSEASPAVALIVIALIPAVCEELLFRGYLFDSFKGKKSNIWAILITAVLFSAAHFDLYKLAPLLIMGLGTGYIAAKTGSVLLPAIFHFINNAMSLISFYNLRDQTASAVTMDIEPEAYTWYAVAAFGIGLVFVYFGTRLLSGKPRRKALNILTVIISIILLVTGVIGVMTTMIKMPYIGEYSSKLRRDTVYKESFVLEKDSLGAVTARVICNGEVSYSVVITDADGTEVYNSAEPELGNGVSMKKGKYTVTYSFDIPDDKSIAYDVTASVVVITTEAAVTSEVSAVKKSASADFLIYRKYLISGH